MYIHEKPDWPVFTWSTGVVAPILSAVRFRQGELLGKMKSFGLSSTVECHTENSNGGDDQIERDRRRCPRCGKRPFVDRAATRNQTAGVQNEKRSSEAIEAIVAMMLDATQKYELALTSERLFGWHSALFPTGYSDLRKIRVANWRGDVMDVVSGSEGKERIHFTAPPAERVEPEMMAFFAWFNSDAQADPLLKAAIAHLWFVTIHPFDDGNGRITRAISELCLARSDNSRQRFYSMSSQILEERKGYYDILEKTQKGPLDITVWLVWFLSCLDRAIEKSNLITDSALGKESFWRRLKSR